MHKDYEVLSFKVDFDKYHLEVIDKLEHFDLAPFDKGDNINLELSNFFYRRTISSNRVDHDLIIQNTGCKNSLELSFKGHGLSLSNHYWFKKESEDLKYDDINFFANKWDDSFAKAVLNGDYESLKNCDLNVPDIVTPGWAIKGWIYDNGPKLYKLGINKDRYEEPLTEVLASRLAQRMLNDGEALKYELKQIEDKYASCSASMLNIDEELIPFSRVISQDLYKLYFLNSHDKESDALFYQKLKENYPIEYYQFFVKLSVLRSLCFVSDLHLDNISLIKNNKTGKMRFAPIYDLAGGFGSSRRGKTLLNKIDKSTYFIIYYFFNTLNPEWDYSWYDPSKLEGFEDEIREILSKSSFYTPELIEKIIGVYKFQKKSLDEIKKKSVTL